MEKHLLLFVLSFVSSAVPVTRGSDQDFEKENVDKMTEVKECFRVRGHDLEQDIEKTETCFRTMREEENWPTIFCEILNREDYPPCFNSVLTSILQKCLTAKDYQDFHTGISEFSKSMCELLKKTQEHEDELRN